MVTSDCILPPAYIEFVDRYFTEFLLPKIKPLLYSVGGPVIMIQVGE